MRPHIRIHSLILLVCVTFVHAVLSCSCLAASFYVRPGGGNYGSLVGTSYENAWSGFKNIKWGATANGVTAGDTIYVCGTHNESLPIAISGTAGSPITISGACPDDPGVIDGIGIIKHGIYSYDQQYINIAFMEVKRTMENGIYLSNISSSGTDPRHMVVSNCTIHDIAVNGISFRGADVKIDTCTVYNIGYDGIYGRGQYPVITNSNIYKVSILAEGDCIQLSTNAKDFYVANNILDHRNNGKKQCFIVASTIDSGGIFEYNTCIGPPADDHYVVQSRHEGTIIRYNKLTGGKYTIGLNSGEVYYNLIKGAYLAGIRVATDGKTPINIYNNTIVDSNIGIFHDSPTKLYVRNNIIYQCKQRGISATGLGAASITESSNCVYGNGVNYFGINRGASSIEADPKFLDPGKDNFYISAESPCKEVGEIIASLHPSKDLGGHMSAAQDFQHPSIGAFEPYKIQAPTGFKEKRD